MPLEAMREKTLELLRSNAPEKLLLPAAMDWFEAFKQWESEETFSRAFDDDRMTARMTPVGETAEVKKFTVNAANSSTAPALEMKLNVPLTGLKAFGNPKNFIDKKKNQLGLHSMSAVLLDPSKPISAQLFSKVGAIPVFMPIPQEGDLQLFAELLQAAKQQRDGELYKVVIMMRASMTRIVFGSTDDMAVGFVHVVKEDGKDHVRYGLGNIQGHPTPLEVLKERRLNALQYKSKIARLPSKTSNNEVTINYRAHMADFPLAGNPGPIPAGRGMPEIKKGQYLLAGFKKGPAGVLDDVTGKITPLKI